MENGKLIRGRGDILEEAFPVIFEINVSANDLEIIEEGIAAGGVNRRLVYR